MPVTSAPMPCHLSTYGSQIKECTSLDGTIKGESAHVGSFPIIVSKSVGRCGPCVHNCGQITRTLHNPLSPWPSQCCTTTYNALAAIPLGSWLEATPCCVCILLSQTLESPTRTPRSVTSSRRRSWSDQEYGTQATDAVMSSHAVALHSHACQPAQTPVQQGSSSPLHMHTPSVPSTILPQASRSHQSAADRCQTK